MTHLLDTTIVSDWMNENDNVAAHLADLPLSDRVIVCPIVRGEIVFGLNRLPHGKRRSRLEAKAATAFAKFACEPVPEHAGDLYAQIRSEQERKGLVLDANDLWIAASAMALGARLVSRDSDFGRIADFPVEDWTR